MVWLVNQNGTEADADFIGRHVKELLAEEVKWLKSGHHRQLSGVYSQRLAVREQTHAERAGRRTCCYEVIQRYVYDGMIRYDHMIIDELPHSCFVIVGDCWSPGRQYRRQPCSPRPSRWDHGGRQTGCAGVLVSSPRESWKEHLWWGIWFLNMLNFNVTPRECHPCQFWRWQSTKKSPETCKLIDSIIFCNYVILYIYIHIIYYVCNTM